MTFKDAHRTLAKWLNEEIEAPIDRQALAVVLAESQQETVSCFQNSIDSAFPFDSIVSTQKITLIGGTVVSENEIAFTEYHHAQPTPLLRLDDEEIFDAYTQSDLDVNVGVADLISFANKIMDAMQTKNGGAS